MLVVVLKIVLKFATLRYSYQVTKDETHDAFFKILSRKKPMYVCLVDGCPKIFKHEDKRTRHLIQFHQYPESFSFQQQEQEEKKKPRKNIVGTNKDGQQSEIPVDFETTKKREARKRRRQQKKKRLLEQIKRRENEMQVDATSDLHDEYAREMADIEMGELEEAVRKLYIPKSIHFGQKRRM
ncbi:hypothetical protein PsorP6_002498 [Peronosclerospora sorghi]|uniref:Uncharacterized protein n=1 Tax=Peronosclerospora sorghi TaxID=230839 RepID=A0ACC0WU86_9STRA|nr:hypothetical protein PsorP6_002498 [Peronosclerospora sorghi]